MSLRAGMVAIVSRVRTMIGDSYTDQTLPQYEDQQIQDALDRYGTEHLYDLLTPQPTIAAGGAVTYLEHLAAAQWWASDATFCNAAYAASTPTTTDYFRGRFTWGTTPAYPMMISGYTYDVFGAAADLLEEWAAALALEVDYKDPNYSFALSQRQTNLRRTAQMYRSQQQAQCGKMIRSDAN